MAKINILDQKVAQLIAAGEVVERPSSVIKELVENAVDSGAAAITVEIQGGGIRLMRITDNGCGIPREELPKAFLRHATSKLKTSTDLESILTMGFRGEALASIAAVCRVEMTTKTAEESEGTFYRIQGGKGEACIPIGAPTGTTIVVKDIFYNTPARMKFLKKDITEGNSVAAVVEKCALANSHVAFKFIRDGQLKLQTSGNGELLSVIYSVFGKETARGMLPVDYTADSIRVAGYIGSPQLTRATRSWQNFFINARYVRSRTCSAALEEAFKHKIMVGKFPCCVLDLQMAPELVDVNVHPAKIEVRFVNERPVFGALYFAVQSTLAQAGESSVPKPPPPKLTPFELAPNDDMAPQGHFSMPPSAQEAPVSRMSAAEYRTAFSPKDEGIPVRETSFFSTPMELRSQNLRASFGGNMDNTTVYDKIIPASSCNILEEDAGKKQVLGTITMEAHPSPTEHVTFDPKREALRLIGELFGTYILLQSGDELLMADKHAAHERLLYEEIRRAAQPGNRQLLVVPVRVSLSAEDYSAALENLPIFEEMGFLAEDFGGGTLVVREVPIELSQENIRSIVEEIAAGIAQNRRNLTPSVLDSLYESIACRSAIKAHDKSSRFELEALIQLLQENPHITHCPHGRPIFIRLGRSEIEKMFGRLG
ncbi:DNA mismatch repair endonuclease MutL [Oscillospiraceae bacterium MB08-C2-2]|nr:DNA mismatch repair endonuclease MutL [Oscillospiraceae bacterium MB08-C2-2]